MTLAIGKHQKWAFEWEDSTGARGRQKRGKRKYTMAEPNKETHNTKPLEMLKDSVRTLTQTTTQLLRKVVLVDDRR